MPEIDGVEVRSFFRLEDQIKTRARLQNTVSAIQNGHGPIEIFSENHSNDPEGGDVLVEMTDRMAEDVGDLVELRLSRQGLRNSNRKFGWTAARVNQSAIFQFCIDPNSNTAVLLGIEVSHYNRVWFGHREITAFYKPHRNGQARLTEIEGIDESATHRLTLSPVIDYQELLDRMACGRLSGVERRDLLFRAIDVIPEKDLLKKIYLPKT